MADDQTYLIFVYLIARILQMILILFGDGMITQDI